MASIWNSSQAEGEAVLVDDGFGTLDAADLPLLGGHDGVVVREELAEHLTHVLHPVIIDVEHLCWHELWIQEVLHRRLTRVLGLVVWLRNHRSLPKELDPALEVRHDSVLGAPLLDTVRLLLVLGGALGVVDLVVQDEQELVCPRVVCRGQVRVLPQSILEHLPEDVWLQVLIVLPLEDLVLREPLLGLGSFVDAASDQLLESSQLHGPLCILDW